VVDGGAVEVDVCNDSLAVVLVDVVVRTSAVKNIMQWVSWNEGRSLLCNCHERNIIYCKHSVGSG
jgi:hypothetical protein